MRNQCIILDAWSWCTGTTQRDGTGKEEGGGFRMGNTCIPVAMGSHRVEHDLSDLAAAAAEPNIVF